MPEHVIEYTFRVTNAEQVVAAAQKAEQAVDRLAQRRGTATIDAETTAFDRKMAEIQNTTARLRAQHLQIPIDLDTRQADLDLEQLKRQTRELQALATQTRIQIDVSQVKEADSAVGSLLGKLGNIAAYSAGYQAFRLFEQGVGAAGQAIVGFNAELEQTNIAFTQAFGSSAVAKDFLNQLEAFAARTPFQFSDVTKLSQQLMAMGVASRDVIPDLTAIGNAVAGVGGSADVLQRVVLAFGQINTAGRANSQDLRQMTEAGINAFKYLADAMGTSEADVRKRIEAGTVDSATALNAIIKGMNAQYAGLMEQQSKTVLGRVSNLKDDFSREAADLGKPLFDAISQSLDEVNQLLKSTTFKETFRAMAGDAASALQTFGDLVAILGKIPAPVIETGIHLAELVVGLKAIEAGFGAMRTLLGPITALLGLQTKAVVTQNEALVANTALWEANGKAKLGSAEAGVASSAGGGIGGAIGNVAGGSIFGKLGGALTGGDVTGLGAAGVGAGVAVSVAALVDEANSVIRDVIKKQWSDALSDVVSKSPGTPWGIVSVLNDIVEKISGKDFVAAIFKAAGYDDLPALFRNTIGNRLNIPGGLGHVIGNVAEWADIGQEKAPPVPTPVTGPALEELQRSSQMTFQQTAADALTNVGKFTIAGSPQDIQARSDTVRQALTDMAHAYEAAYGDTAKYEALLRQFNDTLDQTTEASKKQLVQQQQQHDAMLQQADEIKKEAAFTGLAEPADVMAGLEGTDKASADQVKLIKERYDQMVNAQKEADSAMLQEEQNFQQRMTQAVSQTQQAVGQIDLSKGLTALGGNASALENARQSLAGIGQQDQALDTLTGIAERFKSITDAEHEAARAYEGYLTLFDETDQRIRVLDDMKKRLDDAVTAAKEAQKTGTITPQQQELLAKSSDAYANIAATKGQLQANQAGDILNMGQVMPKLTDADQTMRSIADTYGGLKNMSIEIETNVKQVEQDLNDLVNKPRTITIDIKTNAAQIEQLVGGNAAGGVFTDIVPGTAGGYARPISTALTGGGPNGNGSLNLLSGGNGNLAFSSLSQSQYSQIVTSGPLANPQAYAALMAAAQAQNVDPRALLAFMKYESQYGNDPNAGSITGIKSAGQPGSRAGATSSEGDAYAAFSDIAAQMTALAKNLTTGAYAQDFAAGNLTGIRQRYVAGSATPTGAQQRNIGSTVDYYNQLVSQFPGTPGGGTVAAGADPQAVANNLGNQIVSQALQQVGKVDWDKWCEQFVEDMIAKVTGGRGPAGGANTASQAFQQLQGKGLQVTKAQAQPGDLVYYPDAAGGTGHVAIYMGAGKQIGSEDIGGSGIHVGTVGSGAQFVHIPGVGAAPGGAPISPISGGENQFATANIYDPNSPAAVAARDKAKKETDDLTTAITHAIQAEDGFRSSMSKLDPRNVGAVQEEFTKLLPLMQEIEKQKLGPDADDVQKQTAVNEGYAKAANLASAWGEALTAIDSGSEDIAASQQKIADIAGGPVGTALSAQLDIMKEMKDTGDQIASLTDRKAQLEQQQRTQQQADAEADRQRQRSQQLEQRSEQDADRERQRSSQLEQRGIEDERTAIQRKWTAEEQGRQQAEQLRQVAHETEMRRIQDETTAENDRYTVESRQMEDQQRALEHYGTVEKQQLEAAQHLREDAYRESTAARNAQTQLGQAGARAAGTNVEATAAGAMLASLKDAQVTADELYQDQTDANKKLQDAQDQAASDALYNLQTQQIAEQRAHEDTLNNITEQSTASDRAFQDETTRLQMEDQARQQSHQLQTDLWADEDKARQRSSEDQQYNIETERIARQRQSEDEQFAIQTERDARQQQYEAAAKAIDDELQAQQKLQTEEKDRLQAAQSAVDLWRQADSLVGSVAQNLVSSLTNIPESNIPTKAAGGYVSGMAIVGDSPTGDMTNAEVVVGTFTVIPHGESVKRGLIPGSGLDRYVNGTGGSTSSGGGDQYNLTFVASGNSGTDEQMFQRLTAWVAARDRARDINVRRNSMGVRNASEGGGRW